MEISLLFFVPFFLCWGSFLNMLSYRLMHPTTFKKNRSFCPKCKKTISWYDNIPILSFIVLRGFCRNCKEKISLLYPFVEIFTTITLSLLYLNCKNTETILYFPAYFVFFSALIITIRTDIEFMLISQFATTFLIPLGIFLSTVGLLDISFLESAFGALVGYGILLLISKTFYLIAKKDGIGQGDLELLAFVGSFIGAKGCWYSLLIGSVIGSIFGIAYLIITKQSKSVKMPFGQFISIGAIIFVLFIK